MKLLKALFVLALVVAFAVPAYAETQNVKVSGSIDMYGFYRHNYDLRDGNDSGAVSTVASPAGVPAGAHPSSVYHRSEGDAYFMTITQLEVSADLTDNVSTVVNLINQRDWNVNPDNEFDGIHPADEASQFNIQLDLAYVQMKEIFYSPLTLTVGRQDLLFGRGFIVGWNPQNPVQSIQATEFTQIIGFDAIRATLDFSPWTIDFVYSKIAEGRHDPEDDKDLYITNINYKFAEYNAVAEVYYVGEIDKNTLVGTGTVTGDTRSNDAHTIGGRVQFDPISQITLGGEIAYQFGNYRSTTDSSERDRDAWALDLFGEYRWDYEWKPMVGIEYVFLSGEEDTGVGSSGSYSAWNGNYRGPVYGWIRDYQEVYYATGQSTDQPAGQNQQHISVYGSIKPLADLQLSANYFHFWSDEDVHVIPGDLDSATLDTDIGDEIDTAVVYNYTEDVTFAFYANWFIPGSQYTSDESNDAVASEYISRVTVTF